VGWPAWAEDIVSLLVVAHLTALAAGALGTPPMSLLEASVARFFRPYFGLVDMGYSYRFYAPEPTPTAVILATLHFRDGSEQTVRIPDRRQSGKLTHQRTMALANTLMLDSEAVRRGFAGHQADRWARSYARHLGLLHRERGCVRVTIALQMHLIPELERARRILAPARSAGLDLDAAEFFTQPERIGEFPCGDF
jgi:hypothetical protein